MFGLKLKQTQAFTEKGLRIPVTIIQVPQHKVSQIKKFETDRYMAVKIALQVNQEEKTKRKSPLCFFREIRLTENDTIPQVGEEIKFTEAFKVGDIVNVSAVTKGKGFQGVVKRHGFAGGPKTHGQSDRLRAPGSIGSTTTPGRVYKGKHMAGRLGGVKYTIRGLKIIEINEERKQITIKGLVPGARNNLVKVIKQ
jgi:large subunit ribosomal protein L3